MGKAIERDAVGVWISLADPEPLQVRGDSSSRPGDRLRRQEKNDLPRVRRAGRTAGLGLAGLGVEPGDTVAVMDWDTHRYLECFFAIPMMGAVLHTINIRLSPEQILYTINHAEDDVILVNSEFLPILEQIWDRVDPVKKLVLLDDSRRGTGDVSPLEGEYEALLAVSESGFRVSGARRGHPRHDLLYHRHDRAAQRRLLQPSPARAAHLGDAYGSRRNRSRPLQRGRRLHADHPDVPCPCLGSALCRDHAWA